MPTQSRKRPGAAAVEFAVVVPLLFLVLAGILEFSRAMTVLGVMANAARVAARAGAVTPGNYSAITAAVQTTLKPAGLDGNPQVTVLVNGTAVTDDASFAARAVPGASISVQVIIPYKSISLLPTSRFLGGSTLVETVVMRKEG
jgi:Flp pilus assembly protein TadG